MLEIKNMSIAELRELQERIAREVEARQAGLLRAVEQGIVALRQIGREDLAELVEEELGLKPQPAKVIGSLAGAKKRPAKAKAPKPKNFRISVPAQGWNRTVRNNLFELRAAVHARISDAELIQLRDEIIQRGASRVEKTFPELGKVIIEVAG